MKKRTLFAALFVTFAAILTGCGGQQASDAEEALPYSPFVEAFTTGRIPRTTPVYLILSQDVDQEKMNDSELKKAMKIRPSVAGEFSFENGRTIVFKPTNEFERNKKYTVTADLKSLLKEEGADKEFSFSFMVLPLTLRATFESICVNEADEDAYDVLICLHTPDRESPETVEPLIKLSEKADVEWQHSSDGKKHELTFKGIPAGDQEVRSVEVSVASNKLGVPKDVLLSFTIYGKEKFRVYDINYVSRPERYIEVTFTKLLDSKQDMRGLAYIGGSSSSTVTVDSNKLRIYPNSDQKSGSLTVYIDANIKAKNGMTLGEDIVREINIGYDLPGLRFIGEGVIVPQSSQVLIPFQAVYLRGVVVRVIKIREQNIGQFLQQSNLDGNNEIVRVGRIITRKTIFLDEDGQDPALWGTYAIDLKQLIDPEPGAIYRVELSYNKNLSAYPCSGEEVSKEQLLAEDEVKFKEELNRFDNGSYYYYDDYDYNWYDYSYSERNDPCSNSFYMYNTTQIGRNVLASNIGLIAKAGSDNNMIVLAHNIINTKPEKGVDITVYNYQYQPLGTATTDENGYAVVTLSTGKPYFLKGAKDNQRTYLHVNQGTSLSLSSFDVSGEAIQKGLKGFIYGDRGVWRPGDSMYLSFMLNDRGGTLPEDHPVVMELYNPLGQLYQKKTLTKGALGIYSFEMRTDPDAPTGAWSVKVHVGGVTFNRVVRVEAIKPNRLKIDLSFKDKIILSGHSIDGNMHVEWLQGATARNLKYEIDASFNSITTSFPQFKDFNFDDPTKIFESEQSTFAKGTTDDKGDAVIDGKFDMGYNAPGMLMANFDTRVYEESGDFSIDALRMPFSPYERYVGIKSPQKSRAQLSTGSNHTFEVAVVNYLGESVAQVSLNVRVYKIYWYWWWSSNNGQLANYISNSHSSNVKSFTISTNKGGKGSFDLNFNDKEWGTYYISVEDPLLGHSTGITAYFDWPNLEGGRDMEGSDEATKLNFKTDKDTYAPGDKITLTLPSSENSRAVVSIENGSRVLSVTEHECKKGETKIKLEATHDMQPNAYLHVTLLNPHGATVNDMPIRMYGVVPIRVTSPESYLNPVLKAPDEIKPEEKYTINVSEKNGQEMAYTVAIVDEGLLDLTRFKTPNPWNAFNAKEALGVNTWDMYKYVVGAYGGRIEQLFSIGGDDEAAGGPKATVNRFKPVVQFDGPFILKRGAKNKHSYTMPNYNGRVRVMIVAGNGKAYGNADKSVMVRKPVMLLGTLPRVIGTSEEMVVPATVFATEKGVGKVTVTIGCSDNMQIMGASSQTLEFKDIADKSAMFRIKVGNKPGAAKVTLTAVSSNDKSVYETDIEVRSVRRMQTRVASVTVEPGKSWSDKVVMPGMDGTNKLVLEVSDVQPVNLSSRLSFLLGYPHGCIEQITSKGFPQLYVKQFASLTKDQELLAENAVKDVLRRHKSYQVAEGGFSYWPGGTSSNAWGTIYAVHFQLEAEMKGYMVSDAMKRNALNNLKLIARNWRPNNNYMRSEEMTQAYRLYVLALAKTPELGAMNRLKENAKLNAMAKWMLAAAYAQAGRADIAKSLVQATVDIKDYVYGENDFTYGSNLRDKSIRLIALVLMNDFKQAAELCAEISKSLSSDDWLSTQTTGFALVALSQYLNKYKVAEDMMFSYKCNGKGDKVKTKMNIWSAALLEKAPKNADVEVVNTGKAPLFLRVITEGLPDQGEEEAYANGLGVDVKYVGTNGVEIDISELEQGMNFSAVVTVKNPTATAYNNIVLTQIFPAGWEILNTRFTDENATDKFPAGVDYQDIRDDRVYSYMDRLPSGRQITIRINLAAVYAGKFYCPPVFAEAMYDNLIRANTEGKNVVVKQ